MILGLILIFNYQVNGYQADVYYVIDWNLLNITLSPARVLIGTK